MVVANSELAIQKGDFETAIKVLADVPPESPAYVKVQVMPYLRSRSVNSMVLVISTAR